MSNTFNTTPQYGTTNNAFSSSHHNPMATTNPGMVGGLNGVSGTGGAGATTGASNMGRKVGGLFQKLKSLVYQCAPFLNRGRVSNRPITGGAY